MLKSLRFLVLLATVSCGYTNDSNNTGKINCNITNSFNNNCSIINNINYINNIEYNGINNLSNSNSNILNSINDVSNKQSNIKSKTFTNKKRNILKCNNKKISINNNDNKELSTEEYYNNLFGNNYNKKYYYESIEKYINVDNITSLNSNKYIIDAYKMFTAFIKNIRYTICEHEYNIDYQDNINIHLYDLKKYAILFDKFKPKKKVKKSRNNLSFLNKYIKTQTQYNISIDEFYNYIVNKVAHLYDETINILTASIKNCEPSYKQNEIIENSKRILEFIVASLINTNKKLNDRYDLQDNTISILDEDRIWVIIEQLDVEKSFINLESNLITKLNKYNNELTVFLDKIITTDKNKDIVINGINNVKIRNNINNLLEKLNIENYNDYKEIKDFFANNSFGLKTKEYFELFKKYSSKLKDIMISKIIEKQKNNINNTTSLNNPNNFALLIEQNVFDSIIYPYFKIIKNSLKNVIINNSIVDNNNSIINAYTFYFNIKLSIDYFFKLR